MKFTEIREKVNLKFSVDDRRYFIARLDEVPEFSDEIFSIIRDKNEVTVISKEGLELKRLSEEKFFKLITFDATLPFGLTGFLSHISTLLADKDIPIFAISAYSSDHIFVREEDLNNAIEVLKKDGMTRS